MEGITRAVDKVLAEHLARLSGAVEEINRASDRVLAAHRVTDRLYEPCPQGEKCASHQKHERIFSCDYCPFVGCSECVSLHALVCDGAEEISDVRPEVEVYRGRL